MKDTLEDITGMELAPPIPHSDLVEFFKLCTTNQNRVKKMLRIFQKMAEAPSREAALVIAVEEGRGERGFSASRLENYFYDYRRDGDWRVAINWSLEGGEKRSLPDEFIDHLQTRVDSRQRKTEQGIKQLRDAWKRGENIPGYGTWRQWWMRENPGLTPPKHCPGFPDGWHKRNLRRYLDSSKFRRISQTIGSTAASSFRPLVYTTRKGLWVGSHIMFDDLEHDFMANSMAEKQAGRPLELFSHDLFSARKIRYGIRVKTLKADGTANKLTERMMRMIFAATFYLDGYSPRGTTVVAEHGTATVRDWLEEMIFTLSGGLVTVSRSGFTGAAAHAGQYEGIRKGNPRHKASLESSNNLVHNVLDHLPGQTGKDIAHRPEGLHAMLDHNAMLLAAAEQMPPAVASKILLDLVTTTELMEILGFYYGYIENDHDHKLEGWEECNHIVQELNLAGRWLTQADVLALPPAQYDATKALLEAGHIQTRPRRMSRREVWDMDAGSLIKIPPFGVCEILGEDLSEVRKVANGMFEFEDAEVGPGEHRYSCLIETLDGHRMELRNGEKFQAFVNPFDLEHLFVRDAKGRYLGVAHRIQKPCRGDYEAIKRAMGASRKREAELLKPLRDRQTEEVKKREENARHNSGLIEDKNAKRQDEKAVALGRAASAQIQFEDPQPAPTQETEKW